MILQNDKYKIIERIEKYREIAASFAKLRHQVIDNKIHNIVVTQDKQGNLVDIKLKYPPHIEKVLKKLKKLETLVLDKKKNNESLC